MSSYSEGYLCSTRQEISTALQESTYLIDISDPSERWLITEQFNCVDQVLEIDALIKNIIRSKHILFTIKDCTRLKEDRATKLGKAFFNCLDIDVKQIRLHYPQHKFSPYFHLYEKHIASKYLSDNLFCERTLDIFNACVNSIRADASSEDFSKFLDDSKRVSRKNSASVLGYVRGLHEHYSKLLVIRIELGYMKELCMSLKREDSLVFSEVRKHREEFFKYLKKELPEGYLAGYIWKLEYGKLKSYHYHVMLLLNGQRMREDTNIAMLLGEHWKNVITQGTGHYFNCNAKKYQYRNRGIGMVCHGDAVMRKNLEEAAFYLTKVDYYVRFLAPAGRAFGKGNLPKERPSGRGRPRKKS